MSNKQILVHSDQPNGTKSCLVQYTLRISDNSTLTVWAPPHLPTTRVVRTTKNLQEIPEKDLQDYDPKDIYTHGNRYYLYRP